MKRFLALSVLFGGLTLELAPVFAAAGIIDCLLLGDPNAEPISQLLREHGGRGEATLLGYFVAIVGLGIFLAGAMWTAVEFD